ncbi:mitochondrial assembly of ribosomal large subunit protein 1-like isoform X1 [Entelurus aequoreus]|uniref:mitochondrial assembly of ribosomal large subunit protein 1-like isoform X1 n=1 Tax=Entelurus aequoreus TaxID=161455 RepID=UPI002B1E0154|nr:mitochondrial assembly of ribosomal large subunit protein 1-like isoform X1 [Entelurus aequoreus]
MNIFTRINALLCQSRVLLEHTSVLTRVCSGHKVLTRHVSTNLASRPLIHRTSVCHILSKRCFSDVDVGRSNSTTSTDVIPDESRKPDSDFNDNRHLSQRPTEAFTLDVLVSLLRQENADEICVIKLPEHIKYAQYFIVVSGVSPRHLRAMALYAVKVYKFLKEDHQFHVKIEGKAAEDWLCIDFGNMVVHFMLPETRDVYELEKLWTLRSYDEQLRRMPDEKLPEDFIFDLGDDKL